MIVDDKTRRWVRRVQIEGALSLLVMIVVSGWIVVTMHTRHAQGCRRARAFHSFVVIDTRLAIKRESIESVAAAKLDRAASGLWSVLAAEALEGC